jgi:hypothetical protein
MEQFLEDISGQVTEGRSMVDVDDVPFVMEGD